MSAQDLNEIFDVVDENDCVVGQATRGEVHARGLFHRAVHLIVLDDKNHMLLQKRSREKDTAPGALSTACAGHVDAGENYETAVIREAREELGIELALSDIFCVGKQNPSAENGWEFVKVFVLRGNASLRERRFAFNRDEIESLHWLSADELFEQMASVPAKFARSFLRLMSDFFEEGVGSREQGAGENFAGTNFIPLERLGGNGILRVPVRAANCRRMTLICRNGEISVMLNRRYKFEKVRDEIELFLVKNRPWIEHQLARLRERKFVLKTAGTLAEYLRWNPRLELPMNAGESVKFAQIEEVPLKPFLLLGENDGNVIFGVRRGNAEADLRALLRQLAGTLLPEQLRRLARRVGVTVGEIKIRDSQRQWGSCTSGGNVSLKWTLILQPRELRDHVMLHELCHRRHMNHSGRFWAQLNAWDADCARHDAALALWAKRLTN